MTFHAGFFAAFCIAYDWIPLCVQHVTDDGMVLVKQAEDAASNKKVMKCPFSSISVHLFHHITLC